jgi:hypothetical protein
MALTIEQKIAQKEDELARLKMAKRKLETGQKIIIGGLIMNVTKTDVAFRKWLLEKILESVIRDSDRKRILPFVEELKKET